MATIELRGIEKRYGDVHVVKKLDLQIQDGEFIVLVGPSGCGKSTTLRMIAGLESITAGDLLIDGKRVNDTSPGDRDLAMVFQSYALYPHMSVRDNIAFGLKVRGAARADIDQRVAEASRMLSIEPLLARKPKDLSGGQRQRVAMARAIVRRPKAFLFDEPLSNLDAKLRMEVRAEIAKLRRTLGTTTVYVTHDQVEAMTLADRVVVLNEGIAQQIGAPLDVYRRPANKFVATFLGTPTMNLVAQSDAKVPRAPTGAASVGVRPHDVHAMPAGGTSPGGFTRIGVVKVDMVERLGQESFAYGELFGARVGAVLDENASEVRHGDEVALYAVPDKLHFFAADGRRVDA